MPRPADDAHPLEQALQAAREFPFGRRVESIEFIDKGFSPDRKYRVKTSDGDLLLRLCNEAQKEHRREEFGRISQLFELGFPVAEALRFESVPPFVGGLFRWIEGESGEVAVPAMGLEDQATAGWEAGVLLRRLHHALQGPEETVNEAVIRGQKFEVAVEECATLRLDYPRAEELRKFVETNLWRLESRPVVFRHGDYHPANLIFQGAKLEAVIDFNRCDFGDPYDDFYKLAFFAAPLSPGFASGLIAGYFGGTPPVEFWPIYNVYVAAVVPADLGWCARLFPSDLERSRIRVAHVVETHDFADGGPPSWWCQ
jgi:aminoglycoside phosphotransferase (APT) family kinase protein